MRHQKKHGKFCILAVFVAVVAAGSASLPPCQELEKPEDSQAKPQQPAFPEISTYVLGPDDVIAIKALNADEIGNSSLRIDPTGYISLPLLGRFHIAGLTVGQLESDLRDRMKQYYVDPIVAISIVEYRSQPVSVLGAVNSPGIKQLEGRKNLVEVLSLAGGLRNDAGHTVKITRREEWGPIPLPSASKDPNNSFYVAEVKLRGILEATSPEDNIQIKPNDIITVPRADIVYVIGEVRKPGGFVLSERGNISALQALAMADGLARTAVPQKTKIIRPAPNEKRIEISINLKDILNGKKADFELKADDIMLVPGSGAKSTFYRTLEIATTAITSAVIYRGVY